jgi:signal transduction histidine kinase
MMPKSLRSRVTTVGVITMALVLGIGAWVTVRALASGLRSDLGAQNEEVLGSLVEEIADGANVSSLLLPIGSDGTEFLILDDQDRVINASLLPATPVPGMTIEGGVIQSGSVEFGPAFSEAELEILARELGIALDEISVSNAGFESVVLVDADDWFETRREVVSPNNGPLTLIATTPIGVVGRSLTRLSIALAIIVPVLVALGGWALWVAIGAALGPIQRISDEANRIAPSNSGDRLPVPETGDEIAALTATLNNMLDRLDDGLIRQRQFISDASHELRSPLTTITGAAELVASRSDLPSDAEPTVALLQRGVSRLEAVLDDVTQLAEGDAGLVAAEVDLDDLIKRELTTAASEHPDIDFDGGGLTPMSLRVHELSLSRAVQNLVANAARHADAKVAVATEAVLDIDDLVAITVDDDGPGVAPEDRDRIFDRFVRLDDARSRASGGSGLGLSIVASIARTHGGSVTCGESPLGGARFTLMIATSL